MYDSFFQVFFQLLNSGPVSWNLGIVYIFQEEKLRYAFYVSGEELRVPLGTYIEERSGNISVGYILFGIIIIIICLANCVHAVSMEEILTIVYRQEAVFRTRPVSRISASIPGMSKVNPLQFNLFLADCVLQYQVTGTLSCVFLSVLTVHSQQVARVILLSGCGISTLKLQCLHAQVRKIIIFVLSRRLLFPNICILFTFRAHELGSVSCMVSRW